MLHKQLGINGREMNERVQIFRITAADRAALRDLKGVIEPHMTQIVDAFYDHLLPHPAAVAVVQGAGTTVEKLKKTNPGFFAELFRAEFDEQYYESRAIVGKVHAVIGLEPKWFYAAMSTYYDEILPIIVKAYRFSPGKLSAALTAFMKAFNLDQELIIEAYIQFGFIEQRIAGNLGVGDEGLRAVTAVFRAESAFGVLQKVEMNLAAEMLAANTKRRGEQLEQLVVRRLQDGQRLVDREFVSVEDALSEVVPVEINGGGRQDGCSWSKRAQIRKGIEFIRRGIGGEGRDLLADDAADLMRKQVQISSRTGSKFSTRYRGRWFKSCTVAWRTSMPRLWYAVARTSR